MPRRRRRRRNGEGTEVLFLPRSVARVVRAFNEWRRSVLRSEPVLSGAFLSVVVALAAAFGLELEADDLAITVSVISAIVAFVVRKFVSPTK